MSEPKYVQYLSVAGDPGVHIGPLTPPTALCGAPVGPRNGSEFSYGLTGLLMCVECSARAMEMQAAELREHGRVSEAWL